MKVITTHYIAPAPNKGARIRAKCGKLSKMYPFPHGEREPHTDVARQFAVDSGFHGVFYHTALSGTSHLYVSVDQQLDRITFII